MEDEAGRRLLTLRFDLKRHSPAGFEWGYGGSGPAQLALALAADAVGDDRARRVYQPLKCKVVAALAGDAWTLSEAQVLAAVADIERVQGHIAGEPAVPRESGSQGRGAGR